MDIIYSTQINYGTIGDPNTFCVSANNRQDGWQLTFCPCLLDQCDMLDIYHEDLPMFGAPSDICKALNGVSRHVLFGIPQTDHLVCDGSTETLTIQNAGCNIELSWSVYLPEEWSEVKNLVEKLNQWGRQASKQHPREAFIDNAE